jgi:hypothetical protein
LTDVHLRLYRRVFALAGGEEKFTGTSRHLHGPNQIHSTNLLFLLFASRKLELLRQKANISNHFGNDSNDGIRNDHVHVEAEGPRN